MDLTVEFAGIRFKNPIVATSGTFGNGSEYRQFFPIDKLGGITLKAITLESRKGNPAPRVCETEAGMLNSIGLQNNGWDYFKTTIYPQLKNLQTNIITNVAGNSIEEYVRLVKNLSSLDIQIIELNVSCPNVKAGAIQFGVNGKTLGELVKACRRVTRKPLMVKLSPNVTSIADMAKVCEQSGADALSLVNTFVGMRIDINKRIPTLSSVVGGYSGVGIKPIALRMVYEVRRAVNLPLLGMGGVSKWQDAIEFLLAGANLVGIGTANLIQPQSSYRILKGTRNYCRKNKTTPAKITQSLLI